MARFLPLLAALPLALATACGEDAGAVNATAGGSGSGAGIDGPGDAGGTYLWGGPSTEQSNWSEISGPRLRESLPPTAEPVDGEAVPTLRYLEDFRVHAVREVLFFDGGIDTGFHEALYADGEGSFRLDPLEVLDESELDWQPAPPETLLAYEARGRFLVRFRDPHLGHPHAYDANYTWFHDAQPRQVAGRACTMWSARSRFAFGGADYLVDDATGLLLGWALYGPGLVERVRSAVLTLDFDPELDGIDWQLPAVASETYLPDVHGTRIGFEPIEPQYLPPGFYLQSQEVLASGPLLGEPNDLHVMRYHDGVQPLFVVQQKSAKSAAGGSSDETAPITTVRHSRVAGVEMVEGRTGPAEVYVTGTLPAVELETVFGSLVR